MAEKNNRTTEIYDIKYFERLGFTKAEATVFVELWKGEEQTPERTRLGIEQEKDAQNATLGMIPLLTDEEIE